MFDSMIYVSEYEVLVGNQVQTPYVRIKRKCSCLTYREILAIKLNHNGGHISTGTHPSHVEMYQKATHRGIFMMGTVVKYEISNAVKLLRSFL